MSVSPRFGARGWTSEFDIVFDIDLNHNAMSTEKIPGLSDQLLFLAYSGFHSAEACAVKWSQVDFRRRVIRYWNQKGKRWEDQPMEAECATFVAGLPRKYEPYVLRYRHKSGLSHAVKRINKILDHDESLNVHTLKTCAVGR